MEENVACEGYLTVDMRKDTASQPIAAETLMDSGNFMNSLLLTYIAQIVHSNAHLKPFKRNVFAEFVELFRSGRNMKAVLLCRLLENEKGLGLEMWLSKDNTFTVVGAGHKQFIVYIAIRRDGKTH